MNKYIHFIIAIAIALCLTACCASKKQSKPPANKALPDRNIRDPKIDSLNKRAEKINIQHFKDED